MNRKSIAVPAALFLLAIAVYANSLAHDFVWDDLAVIRDNSFLDSPGAWWRCFGRDFGMELVHRRPAGYYRPLVTLSFVLNHAGAKQRPFAYHWVNVLLHGLNTVLVFWLVARLVNRRTGAFAAGLFAAHPIHAESVAFIAGRSDLLCATFLLLSLRATLRSFESRRKERAVWRTIAMGCYAGALLSKEAAIALPVVLIGYSLIQRHRWRSVVRLCAPATIVALAYVVFRLRFFPPAGFAEMESLPLGGLVKHSGRLLSFYAAQQVFPFIPTLGAETLTRRPIVDVAAVVLLILLLRIARPWRRAAIAALWVAAFLAPVFWVNLFTGVAVNDRFAYIPSIGACALAALTAAQFWDHHRLSRLAVGVVVVVFVSLFASYSIVYSWMWRDSVTLWRAAAEYHPRCGVARYNLAWAYYDDVGNMSGAVQAMSEAAQRFSDRDLQADTYANLARFLAEAGEDDRAVEAARRGLALKSDPTGYRRWLARFLSQLGRHGEAVIELEAVQKAVPDNSGVCLELAREYLALEGPEKERARQWYLRARELGAARDEGIEKALGNGK